MGKVANAKRRAIVEEVKKKDELRKRNFQRARAMAKKKQPIKQTTKKNLCCFEKYGDDLPNSFIPCIDCKRRNDHEG